MVKPLAVPPTSGQKFVNFLPHKAPLHFEIVGGVIFLQKFDRLLVLRLAIFI